MVDVVRKVTLQGGVLVGHDGSAAAGEGVRWAAGLAAALGEPLHVLRAWALLLLHTEHPGVRIAAMNPIRHPALGSEQRAWRVLPAAR